MIALGFETEIGVDIETIRSVATSRRIIERFFSSQELEQFEAFDPSVRDRMFLRYWTQNESIGKANGIGLVFGHRRDWKVRAEYDDYKTTIGGRTVRVRTLPTNDLYCASIATI